MPFFRTFGSFPEYVWVDEQGVMHQIPDTETAQAITALSNFKAPFPDKLEAFQVGSPLPSLSREAFRRRGGDFYIILNNRVAWLRSMYPIVRFFQKSQDVPEMSEDELKLLEFD